MSQSLPYERNVGVTVPAGAEPIARYRERSFGLKRDLVLLPDRMVIHGTHLLRGEWEMTVELLSLNPNSGYIRARPKHFQHGLVMAAFGVGYGALAHSVEARGFAIATHDVFAILLTLLGVVVMLLAIRSVTYAQFRAVYSQQIALHVADGGPDRREFRSFVELIERQIAACRNSSLAQPRAE